MPETRRFVRPTAATSLHALLIAAGACIALPAVQPASAASTRTLDTARSGSVDSTTAVILDRGQALLAEGKFVEARETLLAHLSASESSLTVAERESLFSLVSRSSARLKKATPSEVAIQKAEYALKTDALASAETNAVAALAATDAATRERAQLVLTGVAERRAAVAPSVPDRLDTAEAALLTGNVDAAGATLETLAAWDPEMTPAQRDRFEMLRGEVYDSRTATLAVMRTAADLDAEMDQPGTGRDDPDTNTVDESFITIRQGAGNTNQGGSATGTTVIRSPEQAQAAGASDPFADPIASARDFEASEILARADSAFMGRRLNEAANLYERLLADFSGQLTPSQRSQAEGRLAETRVLIRGSAGPSNDILSPVIQQRSLAKQQALAEFNNQLEQASASLESGDTSRARDLVIRARLTLNNARQLFPESEYQNLLAQTEDRLGQIDAENERIQQQLAAQREAELLDNAAETERARQQDKERKIAEALTRVRALQQEMKYREALQVVDQILFLDPINPAGLLLKDVLYDTAVYTEYNNIQDIKARSYVDQAIENEEALIAPFELIEYPSDWPAISVRRGGPATFQDAPENRAVLAQLEDRSKRLPASFNDNALADVIGFIENVTQLSFDVNWDSLEDVGIERETPITLNLAPVPVTTLLDRVLEKASASSFGDTDAADWAVTDGIVTVASDEVLRRNTVLEIYDIRDLIIEVPDYIEAPDFDLNSVLQSGGGGGGGQSPFNDAGDGDEFEFTPIEERVEEITDIITENVDFDGWTINGGDTGQLQPYGASLIITNTPKNHRAIYGLLGKLREQRAMQINVEARFLIVDQAFFEQIGFDLDVYFNANNNQIRAARLNDPTVQSSDAFDAQGGLSRTVTGAQAPLAATTSPQTTQLTQGLINPTGLSPVGGTQNSLGIANALAPAEGIASTILGAAPALGIAGQFLDDIQVDFLIQATQADTRSVSLTAPRLTFTNGQTSNIYVATQTSFVSDLQPVVSDSAVGFDPTVDVISEGVRLLVSGTVSADRRYVTMNVDAAVADIIDFASQAVTAVAGGQLVSSADTQSFIQLPQATVTRVQTTVTVPDQGTILLGGQRLVSESEVETGVPVLSKIPILNRFFSNRIETKDEQTLLILLKPTILIQNENEEQAFPGLLDSLSTGLGG